MSWRCLSFPGNLNFVGICIAAIKHMQVFRLVEHQSYSSFIEALVHKFLNIFKSGITIIYRLAITAAITWLWYLYSPCEQHSLDAVGTTTHNLYSERNSTNIIYQTDIGTLYSV